MYLVSLFSILWAMVALPLALSAQTLDYHEDDLILRYGDYNSIGIRAPSWWGRSLEWQIYGDLPPDFEAYADRDQSLWIYGTSSFTGEWCFDVSVRATSGSQRGRSIEEEICLYGEENPRLSYPRFRTSSDLPFGRVGQHYSQNIETRGSQSQEVWDQDLPRGMSLRSSRSPISLQGTPRETGDFSFVIRLTDRRGNENFRQFRFPIFNSHQRPPDIPRCRYDERWSPRLGRCVLRNPRPPEARPRPPESRPTPRPRPPENRPTPRPRPPESRPTPRPRPPEGRPPSSPPRETPRPRPPSRPPRI